MDQKLLIDAARTMVTILGALVVGYGLRKTGRVGEHLGPAVNRFTLIWGQPVVIGVALWAMRPPDLRTLALPLHGAAMMVLAWPLSALVARVLPMDRPALGAFVGSAVFSNVGFTFGAFLAFVAVGAQGAALGSVYCISFMPLFFTLGFFLARRYSALEQEGAMASLVSQFRDAETRNPTLGILAGLLLNILRVPAPSQSPFFIDIAMPATTAAFLLAIGLSLRLSAVRVYWRECALMHAVKFVILPALGLALAAALGYWQIGDHTLLRVAFIESATPVAIMSVMLAQVFDLNVPLAGALWLTTNLTATLMAPVILLLARML